MKKTLTTLTLITSLASAACFANVLVCPSQVTCTGQSYDTCSTTDKRWVLAPQNPTMCHKGITDGTYVFTRAEGGGYLSNVQGLCTYRPMLGGGPVVTFYYNFNHRTIAPTGSNWGPYFDRYICTDGVDQCQFVTAKK